MDKRQKNILIWVLTWAGLLLLVLYSPIGSPDIYTSKQYFAPTHGVSFKGRSITALGSILDNKNTIQIKNNSNKNIRSERVQIKNNKNNSGLKNSNSENQEINIPNNTQDISKKAAYKVANFGTDSKSPSYSVAGSGNNEVSSRNSNSNNASGGGGMSLDGSFAFGNKSKDNRNNQNTNGDLVALSAELGLLVDNTNTKESAGTGLAGNTDPGGDPFGDPIPIGDGWIILLVFAGGYALYKQYILN